MNNDPSYHVWDQTARFGPRNAPSQLLITAIPGVGRNTDGHVVTAGARPHRITHSQSS